MRRIALAVAIASLAACHRPEPTPTPTPIATPTPTPSPTSNPRALGLQKLAGDSGADRAITELQRALEHNPEKGDFWILLGRAWVRKARESSDPGFYVNARACAEVALEITPGDRLATDLEGLVLLNDHKFAEAAELERGVLAKDAEDAMAYGNLSDALLELGRFEDAADAAQKMMDIKPNLPSYSRAAYFRWLEGDERAAIEYARLALDAGRDTKDPEPRAWQLVQTAMMFWHRGDYDGADAGFVKALDTLGEYPPALVGRGRVAMAKGDYARAAELFTRALDQSPLPATAWLLGDARAALGDRAGAERAWAHVEKEGPRVDPRTAALFWATKGERAQLALALARREAKTRGDVYTDDAVAWASYRAGDIKDAVRAIDHARRHGTKDARLIYHQGAIHIAAGDVANGRKLVAEALATNPHFDATGEAEARALLESTKPRS